MTIFYIEAFFIGKLKKTWFLKSFSLPSSDGDGLHSVVFSTSFEMASSVIVLKITHMVRLPGSTSCKRCLKCLHYLIGIRFVAIPVFQKIHTKITQFQVQWYLKRRILTKFNISEHYHRSKYTDQGNDERNRTHERNFNRLHADEIFKKRR